MTETVRGTLLAWYCCSVYTWQGHPYNLTVFPVLCVLAHHSVLFISYYRCPPIMSGQVRKRKMDLECHVLRARWSVNSFVVNLGSKAIFSKSCAVRRPINITGQKSCHDNPNAQEGNGWKN